MAPRSKSSVGVNIIAHINPEVNKGILQEELDRIKGLSINVDIKLLNSELLEDFLTTLKANSIQLQETIQKMANDSAKAAEETSKSVKQNANDYDQLNKRVSELSETEDNYVKVIKNTASDMKTVTSATIEYKNAVGELVQEFYKLESVKQKDGSITPTMKPTGSMNVVQDDMTAFKVTDAQQAQIAKFTDQLEKLRGQAGVTTSELDLLLREIEDLEVGFGKTKAYDLASKLDTLKQQVKDEADLAKANEKLTATQRDYNFQLDQLREKGLLSEEVIKKIQEEVNALDNKLEKPQLQGINEAIAKAKDLQTQISKIDGLITDLNKKNFSFNTKTPITDGGMTNSVNTMFADQLNTLSQARSGISVMSTDELSALANGNQLIGNKIQEYVNLENEAQKLEKAEQEAHNKYVSDIDDELKRIKMLADTKVTSYKTALNETKALLDRESTLFAQNDEMRMKGIKQVSDAQKRANDEQQAQLQKSVFSSAANKDSSYNTFYGSLGMAGMMASFTAWSKIFEDMQKGIVDLSTQSAKLQQVFGGQITSQDQLNSVTNQFIGIAKEYGQSVQDVMDSAALWGRQYKDLDTVMQLTQNATLLSVVDNLKVSDANKAVESSMNALGMTAKNSTEAMQNSMKFVDSWSAVAHGASVSAQDLTGGFERSAAAAKTAGLSIDQLNALIAAGVRNTGRSGEVVGNMVKSVLANITSESPKVKSAFDALGISLETVGANGQKQMKPVFDVITELSGKIEEASTSGTTSWNKYFEAISGGKYQYDTMLAALSSTKTLTDNLAISQNSAGRATELAQAQMHTLAAELTRLHDSIQQLAHDSSTGALSSFFSTFIVGANDLINGLREIPSWVGTAGASFLLLVGAIKGVSSTVNFFRTSIEVLKNSLDLVNKADSIWTLLTGTQKTKIDDVTRSIELKLLAQKASMVATEEETAVIEAEIAALNGTTVAMEETTVATRILTGAVGMLDALVNPFAIGLAVLTGVFATATVAMGSQSEKAQELDQSNKDLVSHYAEHSNEVNSLVSKYKDLTSQSKLTTDQQKELQNVSSQLNKLMPELTEKVDEQGQVHLKNATAIEVEIKKAKELQDLQAKKDNNDFSSNTGDIISSIFDNKQKIDANTPSDKSNDTSFNAVNSKAGDLIDHTKEQVDNFITAQENLIKSYDNLTKKMEDHVKVQLTASGAYGKLDTSVTDYMTKKIQESQTEMKSIKNKQDLQQFTDNLSNSLINQGKAIVSTVDAIKMLTDGHDKGSLSTANFKASIDALKIGLEKAGVSAELINNLWNEYVQHTNGANLNTLDLRKAQEDLVKNFDNQLKYLDPLNNAIDKLSKGQQLSHSEILKLLVSFPQLNSQLTDHKGRLELGVKALEDYRDGSVKAFQAEQDSSVSGLKAFENALAVKLHGYSLQLSMITDIATAEQVAGQAYEKWTQKWKDSKQFGPVLPQNLYNAGGADDGLGAAILQLGEIKQNMAELGKQITDTGGDTTNSTNTANSALNGTKEVVDATTQAIDSLSNSIKMQQDALANYPKYSEEYRKGLQTEIDLINQKKTAIENEIKAKGVDISANQTSSTSDENALNAHLGGVFAGKGNVFVDAATNAGISPQLLAAIAMHETGNGTSHAVNAYNNAGGIMGKDGLRHFDSLTQSLDYMADMLKRNYIDQGLTSIPSIQKKYAPLNADNDPYGQNKDWVSGVTHFYNELGGGSITGKVGKQAYDDVKSLTSQLTELNKQLVDANKAMFDSNLAGYDHQIKDSDDALKLLNSQMNLYDPASQKYRNAIKQEIQLNEQKQETIHQEADYIKNYDVALQSSIDILKKQIDSGKLDQTQKEEAMQQMSSYVGILDTNKEKVKELGQQWWDLDNAVVSAYQKMYQSDLDSVTNKATEYTKAFDTSMRGLDDQLKASDAHLKTLKDTNSQYYDELNKQINLNQQKIGQTNQEIANYQQLDMVLQNLINTEGLDEKVKEKAIDLLTQNKQKIEDLSNSLYDLQGAEQDAYQKAQNALTTITNDTVQKMKSAYQQMQQLHDDLISAEIKTEDTRHQNVISNLDTEKKAYDDAYNAQMRGIDDKSSADDYKANLAKEQKTAQDYQNQINAYSMDSSAEASSKLVDLKQKLADQQDKISKLQTDRENTLRKQGLQDAKTTYDNQIDAKKAAEDTQNKNTKDSLDQQKQYWDEYYSNIINDDQKWSDTTKQIMSGNISSISSEMQSLISQITNFAKQNSDAVATHAMQVSNTLRGLTSQQTALSQAPSAANVQAPTLQNVDAQGNMNAGPNQTNIAKAQMIISAYGGAWSSASTQSAKDAVHQQVVNQLANQGINASYDSHSGQWTLDGTILNGSKAGQKIIGFDTGGFTPDGGVALLHQKEMVLNQLDTSNILKVVNVTRDIVDQVKSPDLSKVASTVNNNNSGGNTVQVYMNMSVTGDKNGGLQAFDAFATELKKRGKL